MSSLERFTHRADAYVKARPSYPVALVDVLRKECGLGEEKVVADLGSGTGIFTKLLLGTRALVYAVEPNDDMRAEAERSLADNERFRSVKGTAEATTLPSKSIDLVTAAQAFHWFDLAKTKSEMTRIAKDDGFVALIWNDRDLEGTPFLRDYEKLLLEHCPGYQELQGKANTPEKFDVLFGRGRWSRRSVPNAQHLDRDGLHARVMSASYAPREGEPHRVLSTALDDLFARHERDGHVSITYACVVIFSSLRSEV